MNLLRALSVIGLAGMLATAISCGDDRMMEEQGDLTAQPATGVRLDDATNQGNAADLRVDFLAPAATENVSELRIFIAKSSATLSTPADAEALAADRYLALTPAAGVQSTVLPATLLDTDGDAIGDGAEYVAYVLTVPGGSATAGALSAPSNPVVLAVTTIKITYLRNAGVLIEDGERSVIIDGLTAGLGGWLEMDGAELGRLSAGTGMYGDADVVLATHNHGDHFSPSAVSGFLASVPSAEFLGPPEVTSSLSGNPRVTSVSPSRGSSESVELNGVDLDVLHFRHFDQFGNDFSTVENFGYLIRLGGLRILHVGDVHYGASNLEPFGLDEAEIDVVILPTFNTLLSAANADAVATHIAPRHVLAVHFQAAQASAEAGQATSLFGARSMTRPLDFVRY